MGGGVLVGGQLHWGGRICQSDRELEVRASEGR